jgi:hypothetical protein
MTIYKIGDCFVVMRKVKSVISLFIFDERSESFAVMIVFYFLRLILERLFILIIESINQ